MTPSDIEARIKEIRDRCEKATEGPWHEVDGERILVSLNQLPAEADGKLAEVYDPGMPTDSYQTKTTVANAMFIAESRQDLPWVLDQLENYKKLFDELARRTIPGQIDSGDALMIRLIEVGRIKDQLEKHRKALDVALATLALYDRLEQGGAIDDTDQNEALECIEKINEILGKKK